MNKSEKTLENISYLELLNKTVLYKPCTAIDKKSDETYICTNIGTNFKDGRDTWVLDIGDYVRVYNRNLEVIESYEATEETQYIIDIIYSELEDDIDKRNSTILGIIKISNEQPQVCECLTDFSGHVYKDIAELSMGEDVPLISYLSTGWYDMLQVSNNIDDNSDDDNDVNNIDSFDFEKSHQHCRIIKLNPDNSIKVYYDNVIDDSSAAGAWEFDGHTVVNAIGKSSLAWKTITRHVQTFLLWVDRDHTLMDIVQFSGYNKKYIGSCSVYMNYSYRGDKTGNISSIYDIITILNPIALSVGSNMRINFKSRAGYIDYARSLYRFNSNEVFSTVGSGIAYEVSFSDILMIHEYRKGTILYNNDHEKIKLNMNGFNVDKFDIGHTLSYTFKVGDILFSLTDSTVVIIKVSKKKKSKYIQDEKVIDELSMLYYYDYRQHGYKSQVVKYEEDNNKNRIYYIMLTKDNECNGKNIKQVCIDPLSNNIVDVKEYSVTKNKPVASISNKKYTTLKSVTDLENKVGQIESMRSNSKMLRLFCRSIYGPSVFISCYI